MAANVIKILLALCITISLHVVLVASAGEFNNNYLDVDTPTFFNYNSPLRQPGSLRSRPYFDFLSTLYRRDATKSDLFRPYGRARREAVEPESAPAPLPLDPINLEQSASAAELRPKRAIIFRPLFVYKQQQVRKQELAKKRRKKKRQ